MSERDRTTPYLAILVEKGFSGHQQVHAGLARFGAGKAMCDDRGMFEFWIPARDPNFALFRTIGWRHRYAEAFLEINRGCPRCLEILYQLGREAGYAKPKELSA
jgi:hypothetical protein